MIASRRPPPLQIGYNEEGIEPQRQVLYRNFHMIESTIYLVEISRNARKVFIILFPNYEAADVYKACVLSEKQAQKLMKESNNMFEVFIQKFYLKFGKLQIDGFHNKASVKSNIGRVYNSVSPQKR